MYSIYNLCSRLNQSQRSDRAPLSGQGIKKIKSHVHHHMLDHMVSIQQQRILGSVWACRSFYIHVGSMKTVTFRRSHAEFLPQALKSSEAGLCFKPGLNFPVNINNRSVLIVGRTPACMHAFLSWACDIIHAKHDPLRRPDARHSSSAPYRIWLPLANATSALWRVEKYRLGWQSRMRTEDVKRFLFLPVNHKSKPSELQHIFDNFPPDILRQPPPTNTHMDEPSGDFELLSFWQHKCQEKSQTCVFCVTSII